MVDLNVKVFSTYHSTQNNYRYYICLNSRMLTLKKNWSLLFPLQKTNCIEDVRALDLTIETTFIKGLQRKIEVLSSQAGFAFVGIIRTPHREVVVCSPNMHQIGPVQCLNETVELVNQVFIIF